MILALLCLAATVFGAPRWLRVAQREHYLPGSVAWTDQLWLTRSRVSAALVVPVLGAFVAGILGNDWWFLVAAVLGQLTPVGLPYRGRSSALAWTPRVRRLCVVLGVVVLLLGVWGPAFAALTSLLLPTLVDGALYAVAPLEKRLSAVFLEQARQKVARVRPSVIAITGSYGKTTTKNYLAHLLAGSHTVLASPASFNNAMGLSRAVNEGLVPGTEVFVAEMGTYGAGEIRALCEIFPPDVAVLTAIGEVHLQRMGDRDGVLAAKTEITEQARAVVLNVDDDKLSGLASRLGDKQVVRCSLRDRTADVALVEGRLLVAGEDLGPVTLPESVHPANAVCAVGAAVALGDDVRPLLARLASLPTVAHRLEPIEQPGGSWILDDTYNSNPVGAAEALRRAVLLAERSGGRVHVVTPGMVELGNVQRLRNAELGRAMKEAGVSSLIIVGTTNRAALRKGAAGGSTDVVCARTRQEAVAVVEKRSSVGDVVLFENDLPDHYP